MPDNGGTIFVWEWSITVRKWLSGDDLREPRTFVGTPDEAFEELVLEVEEDFGKKPAEYWKTLMIRFAYDYRVKMTVGVADSTRREYEVGRVGMAKEVDSRGKEVLPSDPRSRLFGLVPKPKVHDGTKPKSTRFTFDKPPFVPKRAPKRTVRSKK